MQVDEDHMMKTSWGDEMFLFKFFSQFWVGGYFRDHICNET